MPQDIGAGEMGDTTDRDKSVGPTFIGVESDPKRFVAEHSLRRGIQDAAEAFQDYSALINSHKETGQQFANSIIEALTPSAHDTRPSELIAQVGTAFFTFEMKGDEDGKRHLVEQLIDLVESASQSVNASISPSNFRGICPNIRATVDDAEKETRVLVTEAALKMVGNLQRETYTSPEGAERREKLKQAPADFIITPEVFGVNAAPSMVRLVSEAAGSARVYPYPDIAKKYNAELSY